MTLFIRNSNHILTNSCTVENTLPYLTHTAYIPWDKTCSLTEGKLERLQRQIYVSRDFEKKSVIWVLKHLRESCVDALVLTKGAWRKQMWRSVYCTVREKRRVGLHNCAHTRVLAPYVGKRFFNPFSARGPIYWPPLCLRRMREADVSAHFFQALQ